MPFLSFMKALSEAPQAFANIDKVIILVDKLIVLAESAKQAEQNLVNNVKNLPQQNSSPVAGSK